MSFLLAGTKTLQTPLWWGYLSGTFSSVKLVILRIESALIPSYLPLGYGR